MRTAFYRHRDSLVADWIILRRDAGNVTLHSNTLNTNITVPESNLIVADRDMTSPMFLGPDEPEASHGIGSSAAEGVTISAASSRLLPPATVARPSSSPGMGGQPRARLSDPETSHLAAARASGAAAANRLTVLLAHRDAAERGLTGYELEQATGMPYESCGPRRPGLEADGLVEWTGQRRPNGRGNMERVYRITEAGRITADRAVA